VSSPSAHQIVGKLNRTRMEMIESTGRLCQLIGMPRSAGQIYGLLYLSQRPMSLDEIAECLAISKASASTGTRQLVAWQALRAVWVPGERRDYFEAVADLQELVRAAYRSFFRPKFEKSKGRLHHLIEQLEEEKKAGLVESEDYAFCRSRLEELASVENRIRKILPLAERFL
jgi:DNA-binding transcriptional regulator GbsR (MarR family)